MAFCQACGIQLQPDARFCTVCGIPVNFSPSSTQSNPASTVNEAAPLPTYSAPAPSNFKLPRTTPSVTPGAQGSEKAIQLPRPKGVIILAIIASLGVAFTVPLGLLLLWYAANVSSVGETPMAQFLIWLFPQLGQAKGEMISELGSGAVEEFLIAAICAVASYGLWRRREWGRFLRWYQSVWQSFTR